MSSLTNPNTCPLCLSPLHGTYHHAPPGREWWTWRCLACDPLETPAYESVETRESLLARLTTAEATVEKMRALLKECRNWPITEKQGRERAARIDALLEGGTR